MDADRGGIEPHLPVPSAEAVLAAFDPARLTLARERNGLTRRDLALRTGVTATAITQFEKRQARPSAVTLARLAAELGLPVGYFAAGRPVLPVAEEATHFRSLRATRVSERRQARATMGHLAEAVRAIQTVVRLPELRLPELRRVLWQRLLLPRPYLSSPWLSLLLLPRLYPPWPGPPCLWLQLLLRW